MTRRNLPSPPANKFFDLRDFMEPEPHPAPVCPTCGGSKVDPGAGPMPASEAPTHTGSAFDNAINSGRLVWDHKAGARAIAYAGFQAGMAAAPVPASEATDILRDMLAIQEACGLHTDEYAPGSVIEYIKELEDDQRTAAPVPASEAASVPSRAQINDWMREVERVVIAALSNLAAPAAPTDTNQERADFEHWYLTHIEGAELGSRDCAKQWSTWLARSGGFYKAPSDWKIAPMPWSAPASPTDADELAFNAQRLRNVAALVGLTHVEKLGDATLDGTRGAILGQIAGKLRAAPTDAKPDVLRTAVRAMTAMLMENEWAEHISADKDAKALEAEITRLVGLYNDKSPAAQSVRDAAQPTAAPGKEA